MITFFPQIYEDELAFSVLSRYFEKSGYLTFRDAAEDIFINPRARIEREFFKNLNDECMRVIERQMSVSRLIEKHTMTPYYARFYSDLKKKQIVQGLITQKLDCSKLLGVNQNRTGQRRKLRVCQQCIEEDRAKYGECYFHRKHIMWNVNLCPKHLIRLIEVDFPLDVSASAVGKSAETLVSSVDVLVEDLIGITEIEKQYARYNARLLETSFEIDMSQIIPFIKNRLYGTKYLSARGEHTYFSRLYGDMKEFYAETTIMDSINKEHIQRLLNGKQILFYQVVALLLFLEISVDDVCNIPKDLNRPEMIFDREVRKLKSNGMTRNEIARLLGVSCSVVDIGLGKYKSAGRKMIENRNTYAIDWQEKDKEYFPSVKKLVDEFYDDNRRPRAISLYSVRKEIGISQHWIESMPMCKQYILSHRLSQDGLDLKAVVWAVQQVKDRQEDMALWRVCQIVKIGRERVLLAIINNPDLFENEEYEALINS